MSEAKIISNFIVTKTIVKWNLSDKIIDIFKLKKILLK